MNNFNDFTRAIARIYHQKYEDKVLGAGFLISKNYVVTCAHVVEKALDKKITSASQAIGLMVKLDFPITLLTHKLEAKVKVWLPKANNSQSGFTQRDDIAVLELVETENKQSKQEQDKLLKRVHLAPIALQDDQDLRDHPFMVYGFSRGNDSGVWSKGHLIAPEGSGCLQLSYRESDYAIEQGFSGSPIWDDKLGCVVGMAVESDKEAKTAYAMPTQSVKELIDKEDPSVFSGSVRVSTNFDPELGGPIIKAFEKGDIVLFLGAGINLCDSPPQFNLIDLASTLYEQYNRNKKVWGIPCAVCDLSLEELCQISETCPLWQKAPKETWREETLEQKLILAKSHLRLLSQYVKLRYRNSDFYKELHDTLDGKYYNQLEDTSRPRRLHEFLATLPREKRKRYQEGEDEGKLPYKLIVTTNFDQTLEQAFKAAKQPCNVIYYIAGQEYYGNFKCIYQDERGNTCDVGLITENGNYDRLGLEKVPTILKLFGTWNSRFVIAEEHHICYCPQNLETVLTEGIMTIIKENSRLFLGYSLYDSDLLTILYKIWDIKQLDTSKSRDNLSWIVHQSIPGYLENHFVKDKGLEELQMSLGDFITNLKMGIEERWPLQN